MPSQTPNVGLYKVNGETDGNDTFNVDVVLNDNWDKLDAAVGQIQEDLGNVQVPDASLTQKGIVQLSNATNGTRESVAATEKAVKDAYDRGSAGVTAAAAAQARADAAFTQANDGKGKVRTAIIGAKGTVGDADGDGIPTFDELAAGVKTILPNATADAVLDPNMLVVGYSGYDDGVKKAGQMPNRSAENNHMPGLEKTVWAGDRYFIRPPAGYYNGSTWVTAAEPQLTSNNIRNGANVGGIIGTLIEGKPTIQGTISMGTSTAHMVIPVSFEPIACVVWQQDGTGATGHAKLLGMIRNASNGFQTDGPLIRFMFSAADMDYTSTWYIPSQGTLTLRAFNTWHYGTGSWNYIIYAR
ncbi:phage tail protein [Paenibacillus glucanolyticus]|uniref:phage tail protein n=1 Tax=Paenibacillus glucanolyticus TaxID=59843 RepID=UPI0035E27765